MSFAEDDTAVDRTVDYAGLEKATNVKVGDVRSDIFFPKSLRCKTSRGGHRERRVELDLLLARRRGIANPGRKHRLRDSRGELRPGLDLAGAAEHRRQQRLQSAFRGTSDCAQKRSNACSNTGRCSWRETSNRSERRTEVLAIRETDGFGRLPVRRAFAPGRLAALPRAARGRNARRSRRGRPFGCNGIAPASCPPVDSPNVSSQADALGLDFGRRAWPPSRHRARRRRPDI